MGRVKLEIKKLENSGGRQTTYSKRKNGILKKAHELSVLCDVDLALIMFSPSGKPSFCFGKHSIEEVIARLNHLPPQERTKRLLEGLEALKKTFKKLDHDVNVQHFLGSSTSTIKDLADQGARTKTRLAQIHERLGFWTNPDRINDLELVMQMEDTVVKSLEQIRRQKEIFQKEQRVSLERIQLPIQSSDEQQLQQLQHLYWTPSDDIQHVALPQEPKLPAQREMESCTGSTSGSYFGCHSTSSKSEDNSPGQLSGRDNVAQGLQNPYLPHGVYMQGDHNLQAVLGMDQRLSSLNYHAHAGVNNYQPTVTWHDICNRFQPESPAESALGDYFNYQQLMTVPGPTIPSIYETIARDPSHILLDTTPNHFA